MLGTGTSKGTTNAGGSIPTLRRTIPSAKGAESQIVTSNKPFGRWGEVLGDDTAAATDRLVHHAEVIALEATAIASKDRGIGRSAATKQG